MEEITAEERETLRLYGKLGKLELVAAEQGRALSTVKAELGATYRKLGVESGPAAIWRVFVQAIGDRLDELDGDLDADHPEGDGCVVCRASDDIRAIVEGGAV